MNDSTPDERAAFRDFEHQGWVEVAAGYDASFERLTTQAVERLLDAANVAAGTRLLDVASGPGYVAAAATRRGAQATGVDFSVAMVEKARQRHPAIEFREGDAEALPFEDASFDAVAINFGVLHFARPERALAEARRVLRPGGRLAFTVWDLPLRAVLMGAVLRAIEAHGRADVDLPEGPPFFRFADPEESRRALVEAGFVAPRFERLPLLFRLGRDEDLIEVFLRGGVRTRALLLAQAPEALAAIRAAVQEETRRYERDGSIELPNPAVLVSGERR